MHRKYDHITIDGKRYTSSDAAPAPGGGNSRLQIQFTRQYGADSFHSDVARFLAEWYSEAQTVTVHTSGSTGKPKSMQVEKRRMAASAEMTVHFLGLQSGDTALLCMPLPYIAGKMVIVRAIVAGLDLRPVTPCGHPLKDLDRSPDFAAMVPMQVYNSLDNPEEKEKLKGIRELIIGGGAVDPGTEAVLKGFPNRVWSTYGMTETLSHIALRALSGPLASPLYTPFPGVHLECSPENTLIIHAPSLNPEPLLTNDIVRFDENGRFRILGRKDNTINTGGIKVQIEEIEEKLRGMTSLPFLITSVPDPKLGERIVLLTTSAHPEEFSEPVGKLPKYWRPKEYLTVAELPLTGTGKPDRARTAAIAAEKSGNHTPRQ